MKLDIHVHSTYSDGTDSVKSLVRRAKQLGLDGIAITDHNTVKGGCEALKYATDDFTTIPGIEVSSKEGHILVLNVTDDIKKGIPAEEVAEKAHELGGIAIPAHPYDMIRTGIGDLALRDCFDAIEAINGKTFINSKNVRKIAKENNITCVGGSDAHCASELGSVTINLEGDLIDAILKGDIEINANLNKARILKGIICRRIHRYL